MFIAEEKWLVNLKSTPLQGSWQEYVLHEQTGEKKTEFDKPLLFDATWRLTRSADLAWSDDVPTAFYSQKTYLSKALWLRWEGRLLQARGQRNWSTIRV